ncbi:coat protein [Diplodia seriata partitivirus 1]|nr:coat protein [Diplodia seriata partitivirus 1]
MSTVSGTTVLPSDSASQVPDQPKNDKTKKGGKGANKNKRPAKSALDPTAPPGSVDVPPAGTKKTGKTSTPVSSTIPLSGWGEIDLHDHRRDVLPVFTCDAAPYMDLVNTVYAGIQSRYSQNGKHVPRALFVYYCCMFWWLRVLYLHKMNANVLSPSERAFFNVMTAGEEFNLPAPIAQYLANLGNFQQGGEQFYFRKMNFEFTGTDDESTVKKGWLRTSSNDTTTVRTSREFWAYAQVPVPAVFTTSVNNEAYWSLPTHQADLLNTIEPAEPTDTDNAAARPTPNINGWDATPALPHHTSWRATYSSLGWSRTSVPADLQTDFNVSTSSLKWVSDRLASINGLKLHTSKQLLLSVQGNPIQAYFLDCDDSASRQKRFLRDSSPDLENWRCTAQHDFQLSSRYSMDSKLLAPAFSFGYRLHRFLSFESYQDDLPVDSTISAFQPWVFFSDHQQVPPPEGFLNDINGSFNYGTGRFLGTARFETHLLSRSAGLNAAVILTSE